MPQFDDPRQHLEHLAKEVNAALPEAYRQDIMDEGLRVIEDVVERRGTGGRKVLIIGGAGYVGSVVTEHLLNTGYRVRCLDNLLYGHDLTVVPFLHREGYEFVHGDLTDAARINSALDGVTDVVLLAGLVGDPVTKKYPDLSGEVNDGGYDTILDNLNGKGLNKVIFVSTCSNYGLIEGDRLADENFELNPLSLYAKSKVRIEKRLLCLQGEIDYAPTVLRFATAFGLSPRMRFDLTVSEFTRALALGEELLVYDAHTWRPYCHLRDFAELIRRVFEAPRERVIFDVFNAGGAVNNFTKQMIVDAILEQLPEGRVRYQEHGADPRNYRVDFAKVRERLFFTPAYTVPDGIRELVGALRQGMFHKIDSPKSFHGNWEIDGAK